MLDYTNCNISKISAHQVGNKTNEQELHLSNNPLDHSNDILKTLLLQYFLKPFAQPEFFSFTFSDEDVDLNPMYHFASAIFESADTFHEQSIDIAKQLYKLSVHPQIKSGDLFVVLFSDVVLEDELVNMIGIFKSENRHPFLKLDADSGEFFLNYDDGISIDQLDKGCLIFNKEKELGYRVCIVDKANKSEAQFWKNDFLQLRPCSDDYHYTKDFLSLTKDYVTHQLAEDFEVSKTDKIDLLNRTVEYFKTNDAFDKADFEQEVLQNDEVIESFQSYDAGYRADHNMELSDQFDISDQAVKKEAKGFKSVLKLDKNFHVYIHGDRKLIEQGREADGRKFYKLYYEEES